MVLMRYEIAVAKLAIVERFLAQLPEKVYEADEKNIIAIFLLFKLE